MAVPLPRDKSGPKALAALLLILLYFFLYDVLFLSYDQRGFIDHDAFYAGPALRAHVDGGSFVQLFMNADRPPFINFYLLGVMRLFGTTLMTLKLFNFPFFAMILLGVYLIGKRIDGPGTGVAAAFLAGTLPVTVNLSRKFFFDFHTVGPFLLSIALVIGIEKCSRKACVASCLLIGGLMGLALGSHPAGVVYALPVFIGLAWALYKKFPEHPKRALGLFLASASVVLLTAGPWYIRGFVIYMGQKKGMGFFEPLSVRIQEQGWGDFFLRILQARPYSEYSGEVFFSPVHFWLVVPLFLVLAFVVLFRDGRKSLPAGVPFCIFTILYLCVTEAVLTYYPVQHSQVIAQLYLLVVLVVVLLQRVLLPVTEKPPFAQNFRRAAFHTIIVLWLVFGNSLFFYSMARSADASPGRANPFLSKVYFHMPDDVFIRNTSAAMLHFSMIPSQFDRALSAIAGYFPKNEPVTTRFISLMHEKTGNWKWVASKYGRFENDYVISDSLKKKIVIEGIRIKPDNDRDPPALTLLTAQSLEYLEDKTEIRRRTTEALAIIRERFGACPIVFAFPITKRTGKKSDFTDHIAVFLDTRRCLPPDQIGILKDAEETTLF